MAPIAAAETARPEEAFLRRVVEHADLNALRLALYQQTHDPELAATPVVAQVREGSPFRERVIPETHREMVKDKAVAFLLGRAGAASATPTREEAARMMEMFAGEAPSQAHLDYGWEDLAFQGFPRAAAWREKPPADVLRRFSVYACL